MLDTSEHPGPRLGGDAGGVKGDGGVGEAGGGEGDGWDCGKRRCGNGWREEREAGENCQQ